MKRVIKDRNTEIEEITGRIDQPQEEMTDLLKRKKLNRKQNLLRKKKIATKQKQNNINCLDG